MTLIATPRPQSIKPQTYQRLSSVLLTDCIEACLNFWVDHLGFEVRLKVDGPEGIDFVILGRDDAEVVYRSRSSMQDGTANLIGDNDHPSWMILYLQVADLETILPHLDGLEIVIPLRENALGVREVFLREPSGRIVALTSQQ